MASTVGSIKFNHIPKTIEALNKISSQIVRKTAFDIQRVAQQIVVVDTGLLKNSIYVATGDSSQAVQTDQRNIKSKRIGMRAITETFPQMGPTGNPNRALVLVGAIYGIFVERGTIHMAARPFLVPAYIGVKPDWDAAWAKLEALLASEGVGQP